MYDTMEAEEIQLTLRHKIDEVVAQRYGKRLDKRIAKRICEEWAAIETSKSALDVAALYELTQFLKSCNIPYWMRGCAGSCLLFYLLGITTGNPLPPHRHCPVCGEIIWTTDCTDGFDLTQGCYCSHNLPECFRGREGYESQLITDGHNIPWQSLWKCGNHAPSFDIDVPFIVYEDIKGFFEMHWIKKFRENTELVVCDNHEIRRIRYGSLSVLCYMDKAAVQSDYFDVAPLAPEVTQMLKDWQPLVDYNECALKGMPKIRAPKNFAELLAVYGLLHSTGTWDKEAAFMIKQLGYDTSDLISFREDVFFYLKSHGFLEKDACREMENICKGKHLQTVTGEMKSSRDKWVLSRCATIQYLYPKAHALEYILFQIKMSRKASISIRKESIGGDKCGPSSAL